MLYNNFIACMMLCSVLGLLYMISVEDWQYIIFPIGILLWGFFKFFDEDDREYLRRRGINPDEFNAFFPDEYDKHRNNSSVYAPSGNARREGNTISWDSPSDSRRDTSPMYVGGFNGGRTRTYQNPLYKGIVNKCKRNFKISITKETNGNESEHRVFHSVNSCR